MSASLYEITELASGEIILKRSDDDKNTEPLVVIRFSAESNAFLGDNRFEVAKAMIEAGMETANDLVFQNTDEPSDESVDYQTHLLH